MNRQLAEPSLCEGRALTATQIDFLDMAINHLTERGVIEPRLFYESPFTDLNAQGIDGIFHSAEVDQIVAIVCQIKLAAVA